MAKRKSGKKVPTKKMRLSISALLRTEGRKEMRQLLGGKGANLAEMTSIGLPVPPGFTITTETCADYNEFGQKFPAGTLEAVKKNVAMLEKETGKRFGSDKNPLLVSVRSGAAVSMPGMMDTVLNLGRDGETGWYWQTNARHFGQIRTFAPEQLTHFFATLGVESTEIKDAFFLPGFFDSFSLGHKIDSSEVVQTGTAIFRCGLKTPQRRNAAHWSLQLVASCRLLARGRNLVRLNRRVKMRFTGNLF